MSTVIKSPITRFLERVPAQVLAVYAIVAAFSTYFCMYAFRRPFAAANYEGLRFFGTDIDLKTAFVISQILGYMLSKYIGIKVCSETTRKQRMWRLFGLIIAAEVALVLFAVLPAEWKLIAIFCNGLPLGMVWGLVVLYLEGRRTSELLLAGLSCSFIIASGVVKGAGRWLIEAHGYGDFTMPAMTGLIFLVPFVISVFLLNQIPEPTQKDIDARVQRESMNASERMRFMKEFLPGMLMLLTAYFFLTAYRDFRDNYMSNILLEMGITEQTKFMLLSELPVAFGVLVMLGGLFLIRNNRWGLIGAYAIMLLGLVLMGGSTLLLDNGAIRGDVWMVLVGLGAYLAYVPFGSVLFDRLIAATRVIGTAVFAIYVADAIGYTGSVGVQLYKDIVETDATRLDFFRRFTYGMSILGVVLMASSCVYFLGKAKKSLSADR
ncbi:MAG: hypothetical protein CL790_04420 [Chloroflexi bacterium]|nr:hypothetical protein [Chloroflexota bacterium]